MFQPGSARFHCLTMGRSDPPSVANTPKRIALSPVGTPVKRGTETSAAVRIKESSVQAAAPVTFEPAERRKPLTLQTFYMSIAK